jgi:hypothetical protein
VENRKAPATEFLQALKGGKEQADDRVERSLYQRAVGYTHDATHFTSFQGAVTATPYRNHCPPDVVAQIFWLKNRRPDLWRDKQIQEVTGADGSPLVPIINLTGRPEPSSSS